jgi:hypothetical protein
MMPAVEIARVSDSRRAAELVEKRGVVEIWPKTKQ